MSARVPISAESNPISADISKSFDAVKIVLQGGDFDGRQTVMVELLKFVGGVYVSQYSSTSVVHQDGIVRFYHMREHLGGEMEQDNLVYEYLCRILTRDRVFFKPGYS